MAPTMVVRARPISVIAALLLVVLSLGVGGSASADPGHGNGNGGTPPGQAAKAASGQAASTSTSGSTTSQAPAASSNGHAKSEKANAGKANSGKAKAGKAKGSSNAESHATSGTAGTSGDVTKPQPVSNADANKGGANGQCPGGAYCSTRDGRPSANGNGGGKATGKPCMGCVGKADNKNPKGQKPNGSDHNNGYECDGNHGIGRGNPAHTSCVPAPPQTCEQLGNCAPQPGCEERGDCPAPGCEEQGDCPAPGCEENGDCPAPGCEENGDCPAQPGCEESDNCPPPAKCGEDGAKPCPSVVPPRVVPPGAVPPVPEILGTEGTRPRPPVKLATARAAAAQAGVLPATGAASGLGVWGLLGLGLVGAGASTMLIRRKPVRR